MHPSFYSPPPSTSQIILRIIQIKIRNQESSKLLANNKYGQSSNLVLVTREVQFSSIMWISKSTKIAPFLAKTTLELYGYLFFNTKITLYRRKKKGLETKNTMTKNRGQLHYFKLSTRQCRPKIDIRNKERKKEWERESKRRGPSLLSWT